MPSIEENKKKVKEGLSGHADVDHDAILANLQDEIDRHNQQAVKGQDADSEARKPMKFRFKAGTSEPRKRKHRSRHGERDREGYRHRRQWHKHNSEGDKEESEAAHPFPREPTNPYQSGQPDPNAAFRDSLFDALADDEGAAYWENVYSQPIHVYPRPSVKKEGCETDQMNDDEYVAYVQTKMWEKKNPHIILERERKDKQRKGEEGERARRREEFIRRKERAAWERSQRDGARRFAGIGAGDEKDYEYTFDFANAHARSTIDDVRAEYRDAWTTYLAAWGRLKIELLNARDSGLLHAYCSDNPSMKIPWPVLPSKPATRPNIEEFMRYMPIEDGRHRTQQLKTERVKWHPDKVQQRFAGHVSEDTMKVVTGIFQVIDSLYEQERKMPQS